MPYAISDLARRPLFGPAENLRRQMDERGRAPFAIRLQCGEGRRRIAAEIAFAGLDQPLEIGPCQPVPPDRRAQCLDHVVAASGLPGKRRIHCLAPPLEPDAAQHLLAHRLADAGNFVIEGIERKQRLARRLWREKHGLEPIAVMGSNCRGNS